LGEGEKYVGWRFINAGCYPAQAYLSPSRERRLMNTPTGLHTSAMGNAHRESMHINVILLDLTPTIEHKRENIISLSGFNHTDNTL
jgi:hypothetical protein